ncbi:hypothetical protein FHR33_005541 [Nonomuraea dietziae]|uniref:Uncharacterized protein n=1 Tax=Nonomuraea dietziae TaxID=65515 RepID=A0A7W5Y9P3_9ACTN|nr:hypothetical protein [Nonomuraea dietziae]
MLSSPATIRAAEDLGDRTQKYGGMPPYHDDLVFVGE